MISWLQLIWQDIARFRPELRLIISSATLNALKFADFFDEAPVYEGKLYILFSDSLR